MASPEPEQPWYETFFTGDYLEHGGGGGIAEEHTKKETDFIVAVLGLVPGMPIAPAPAAGKWGPSES